MANVTIALACLPISSWSCASAAVLIHIAQREERLLADGLYHPLGDH